jgi:hypothetical protein
MKYLFIFLLLFTGCTKSGSNKVYSVKQTNFGEVTCRSSQNIDICEFKTPKGSRYCADEMMGTTGRVVIPCQIFDDMVE